jgi:NADP-dependent 3-hydroxy acid dehydrogenase YdfG
VKDLTEQVAIITGASSGIGAAVARDLHETGMKVVLTARRAERLQQLAAELGGAVAVAGDLTDPALPQRLIDVALDQFGRCDVIFNNAGIMEVGSIDEIDVDRICHMVRINVEATFRMAYVALKYFKSIDRGYLINVSSILGTKVRPTAGAYAGTKYAIEALTEALRMELARTNVKVSVLEPSLTRTELHDHWQVHPIEANNIQHPLEPADIARTVRWMLLQPDHVVISNILVMPKEQEL